MNRDKPIIHYERRTFPSEEYVPTETYCGLRDLVLRLPLDHPELASNAPIALLVEMGYPQAVVTLVVVADGTTSVYFSNGGGIIGCGGDIKVYAESKVLAAEIVKSVDRIPRTYDFPLPRRGCVRFYVLYTDDSRTYEVTEERLQLGADELSEAYRRTQAVISAIRLLQKTCSKKS